MRRDSPGRILLVLTEFPPSVGGMQTHAVRLARWLSAGGWQVEVATYRSAGDRSAREFDASEPYRVHRVLSRLSFWHNLEVLEALGRGVRLIYASTVFYGLLGHRLGVPVVCRSAGNDVERPWIGWPFPFLSRLLAAAWLDDRLYRAFRRFRSPEWTQRLFRRARWRLMTRSARANRYIFANSAFTNRLLEKLEIPEKRREVLAGGVDAEAFRRPAIPREPSSCRLLTVCRLVPKKGLDTLLEAFAMLCRGYRHAELTIVGDGPLRPRLQRQAGELGIADRVHFTGRVPFYDVAAYYWSADIFVLPSREIAAAGGAARDVETMGRVLCEANAAGVPVVATRTGGVPSIVRDGINGLLVPPADPVALLAGIERLFADAALRNRLIRGGLEAARRDFDWSVVLNRHQLVFTKVLREAARPRKGVPA